MPLGRTENGKQLIEHSHTDTLIQYAIVPSPTLRDFPAVVTVLAGGLTQSERSEIVIAG